MMILGGAKMDNKLKIESNDSTKHSEYSRLTEVLSEMGESELTIQSLYIMKTGCSHCYSIGDSPERTSKPNEIGTMLHKELLGCLEKHPNVFKVSKQDDPSRPAFTYLGAGSEWTMLDGSIFHLEVNLPARLQKYIEDYAFKPSQAIEQFEVLSRGSLFAAFAPISDFPIYTHIGHEYRELVTSVLEANQSCTIESIGPTPIHPDFYIVQATKDDETSGVSVYSRNDDVLVVLTNHHSSVHDWIKTFFDHIHLPLMLFYSAILTQEYLTTCYYEIFERFSVLSESMKNLAVTPSWRIVKCNRYIREGKNSLSEVHVKTIDFETTLFGFGLQAKKAFDQIKSHKGISEISDYFEEILQPGISVPESFQNTLRHFEGEMHSYKQIRSVVIASFLGAAIGAVLTVLLSQML